MPPENKHLEDDFFKDQFNSLNADEEIDQLYRSKFTDFEASPRPELWQKVQPELPFSLLLRRHLYQLSKVAAAVLLIVMLGGLLEGQWFAPRSPMAAELMTTTEKKKSEEPKALPAEAPKEFVLDIEEDPIDKNIGRRLLEQEEPESIDELWAFITDDSDDFSAELNEEKLANLLKPLEKLPAEGLAMALPKKEEVTPPDESNDLTIMIPLKVVEEDEVEHLLNLYDKYKQDTKTVHKPSTD